MRLKKSIVGWCAAVLALMNAGTLGAQEADSFGGKGCANQVVEIEATKTGTRIEGVVSLAVGNEERAADVLVQIYRFKDGPDVKAWDPKTWGEKVDNQVTKKDGKFSFRVKPGKYRLRFSLSPGWNCTYVTVTAGASGAKHKKLKIPMDIGT